MLGFLEDPSNIQKKQRGINRDLWGGGGTWFDYVAQANVFGTKFFSESCVFLELPGFLENSRNMQKKWGKSMETFGGEGEHALIM